jgi:hypothetical protein
MAGAKSGSGIWKRRQFFSFQRGKYGTTMVYPERGLRRVVMWVLFLAALILGIYFLVWHKDPLPGNHEAIGLGTAHLLHDVIGIALLATASLTWYVLRRRVKAAT